MWVEWSREFDCSFMKLNIALAIGFLFLAFGCVIWQPTAMKFGRRFVYLICTILAIVADIVGSRGKNIQSFYGVKLLCGLAAAPVDSLVEISVTDVFFQHERASYLGWFVLALYAGSDLGPVACGYIVETLSWRWCYYILIIIFGVLLVVQLFFMEDTSFQRSQPSEASEERILEKIKSHQTIVSAMRDGNTQNELKGGHVFAIPEVEAPSDLSDGSDYPWAKRGFWQRRRIIETEYRDTRLWLTIAYRPFFLISIPAVLWGGIVYGSQMMWLSLMGTTQSQIYSAPPFSFAPQTVGLTNVSALVGSVFGMLFGGYFVDFLTIKLSMRNNGILEPEFRLWAMFVPSVFNAAGLVAYGIGATSATNWFISVGIGQFLLGFAMAASGGICLTYVVDSYPKLASEALVLMLVIRNLIGCGFTFAIQPWLSRNGLTVTTWLMFMLSIVINGSFVVFLKWGKDIRRWTKGRYYKYSNST
jgi:MFS family permease